MKAVIMAGGEGTRLRPITSLRPKPMVPIVNQPVMEHIIGLVKHHGIDEVVATLAFMPRTIQDYFGAGEEWGVDIGYAVEESPLGTAGSVKNAQHLLGTEEPFLIISGDAVTDIDLTEVLRFHKERGGAVTIALKRVPDPLDFGVVITAENGLVERFLEKPSWGQVFSDTINTGIYVIEPWVLDYIPEGESYDFSADLFPRLMEDGHEIYGIAVDGYWCDVGSRESYMQVHRDILDGLVKVFIPGVHAREGLWVSESARIDDTATLGTGVVLGENVRIRSGAVIGDYTVIDDNCVIGADARVTHSVVWSDTFIGKQSTVAGAVVCRHVDIRARAGIEMGAVIGDESVVGAGAHIGADVRIFPYKRIESSATVNTSVIWESTGSRSLFGDAGVQGLVGVDITPELTLKVAEAYGTLLPKGGHVVDQPGYHACGPHAEARHDRRAERGRHRRARSEGRVAGGHQVHHTEDALRGRRLPLGFDARSPVDRDPLSRPQRPGHRPVGAEEDRAALLPGGVPARVLRRARRHHVPASTARVLRIGPEGSDGRGGPG